MPLALLVMVALAFPHVAVAGLRISEVMFDVQGSDAGREWIEIENTGPTAIDVREVFLREAATNHRLTLAQGEAILAANSFAIIASDAETFRDEYGYSGVLFDSAFSLSNSGERISLRDKEGADIDSLSYSSAWGAAGDGNSLQRAGESFIAAGPTPGARNATTSAMAPGNLEEGGDVTGKELLQFEPAGNDGEKKASIWPYLLALFAIIGIGVGGVMLLKRDAADEYTIVEEKADV